jgi:hypothetical protein
MKKQVVLYKKLSPELMARLQEKTEVTLIESLDNALALMPGCVTPCPAPTACSARA